MLLEALVACAGVTLKSVATAIDAPLKSGTVSAEGDLDFRGTLGVDKEAPVGFAEIRLRFDVDTDAPQDKLDQLLKLTERYCVVYQTIKNGPEDQRVDQSRVMCELPKALLRQLRLQRIQCFKRVPGRHVVGMQGAECLDKLIGRARRLRFGCCARRHREQRQIVGECTRG